MSFKIFGPKLPVFFSLIVLLLLFPVLLLALSQKQEIRKEASGTKVNFPQVDLNDDGLINNVDLRIYLENISPLPKPQP